MKKSYIAGASILVLLIAGMWLWRDRAAINTTGLVPQSAGESTSTPSGNDPYMSHKFIWSFADAGEDKSTFTPMTMVTLAAYGQRYNLGLHAGSCSVIDSASSWKLVTKETSGVICWWAGGGTELGIFEEDGKFTVKQGELDEGTAETAGVRGNFKTLFAIPFNFATNKEGGTLSLYQLGPDQAFAKTGLEVPLGKAGDYEVPSVIVISADGQRAAFTIWNETLLKNEVFVSNLDGLGKKLVARQEAPEGNGGLESESLSWSADGKFIVYSERQVICDNGCQNPEQDLTTVQAFYKASVTAGTKELLFKTPAK